MINQRLYYSIKPFIPQRARMWLRRAIATRRRDALSDIWPISESASTAPLEWPGWPDGKEFCFALSHDVEGRRGYERVKSLAELEMEYGLRSSFNFIPEGEYEVSKKLREWLVQNGFEVGIHDLKHDGHLYRSREHFAKCATRINKYAKEWGAVGFRSGFMLHNLDWIHDLNIEYDASTFDTDPFEPQPDGANTIFPFWVSNSNSKYSIACTQSRLKEGYIELPYTLPHDSTLFLLFKEQTNKIWIDKLSWIVKNGGFAFLNLHPDYIGLRRKKLKATEFDPIHYRSFLECIKSDYDGRFWHALPREVANYCRQFRPERSNRTPKNICMVAFTHYESDGRVLRYARTLRNRGDRVDVVSCSRLGSPLETVKNNGVTQYKIFHKASNRKGGAVSYFIPLIRFAAKVAIVLTKNNFRLRYDLIHVHNIPEWLVFSTCIPRLTGSRIILDFHDLVPELFSDKFKKGGKSVLDSALKWIERASCEFSDHIIISNHIWENTITNRSAPNQKCSVFFNNIDPDLFYQRRKDRNDNRKIVIFPGTLQWHQGVDIIIRCFPKVLQKVPNAQFHIYGGGGVVHELLELIAELKLEDHIIYKGGVPISEIPQIVANTNDGVVPKRADSFGNQAYSTKIMEFMSQGVPTVISRTEIDEYYFDDSCTYFCDSGDVDAFAEGIIRVLSDDPLREKLIANGLKYVDQNNWNTKKREYLELVDGLVDVENENDMSPPVSESCKIY